MKSGKLLPALAAGTTLLLLASCGAGEAPAGRRSQQGAEPFAISIMSSAFSGAPAGPDNRILRMLEQYTNTRLDITWVPNASYTDKLNITLASGRLPMLLKAENTRTPAVANAIQAGAFWDLGPYLKNYPNLSKADPEILRQLAVDGKIYGIYRSRPQGRHGISYRKDWLDRLGLKVPATIDEFYEVLKAFTYKDPDGNGKQDTYGLTVSKYSLPWDVMQLWFGAPNQWGTGPDGALIPDFTTPEYREALRFFHRLYAEKLVNADFPIHDPARWNEPFIGGQSGVMVDVADTAGRLESALVQSDPSAVVDVAGYVTGPGGARVLPTPGYSGIYMVSKSAVSTEKQLLKVLEFLDRLNDPEMQRLLTYGMEDIHYTVKDGRLSVFEPASIPADSRLNDLSQLLIYIPERTASMFKPATPLRDKVQRVMEQNQRYLVPNPAAGLDSQTHKMKGTMLDSMIEEARTQYIVGKLDDAGWERTVQAWRESGGDRIIRETNAAYQNRTSSLPAGGTTKSGNGG
ncbi:extracellular solute-binding protein [Gorillibacterium sp. sgz5001074]|uniref:extracellular solute-binding protein n=1 Tax=Gorillibacterium sp. sgz5001074 TaxID=3446695 RepID=UPI003F669D4D